MKNLVYKEWRLAAHPTVFLFWGLSLMLMIPNYPYYVTFFYTCLGLFFTCLGGRENHDIFYTMCLPVRKRDVVGARILFAAEAQLIQFAAAAAVAVVRISLGMPGNAAGMDGNAAFFGSALCMTGLFNMVFFTQYYKDTEKVGRAFMYGSAVMFLYMLVAEASVFVVPRIQALDNTTAAARGERFIVLAVGIVLYFGLTVCAYRLSSRVFDESKGT